MQLTAFRVQNYKIIEDTEWVPLEQLNIFVGKNESGKSAIFRGLSKLNPSDGEGYDGLKEFPRRRYAREITKDDWPVASGKFVLTDEEKEQLVTISDLLSDVNEVTVTRHYTGKYHVQYHPEVFCDLLTTTDFGGILSEIITNLRGAVAPDGKGEELGNIKEFLLSRLDEYTQSLPADMVLDERRINEVMNFIMNKANEEWQRDILSPLVLPLEHLSAQVQICEKLAAANVFIIEHIPRFIYFDNYEVIESAVHIPTFLSAYNGGIEATALRATNCLFLHVNLDPNMIDRLGSHKNAYDDNPIIRRQVDERAILLSAASNQMTEMFENWWEQRHLRFRYDIDGDYFRIWVSDNLDPSEIELEQRSAGLQYFFSFYLIFLVEASGAYQNSVILLDEPGVQLHPTAQRNAVAFLKRLSEQNQILYSTHSPFLLDMEGLDTIHIVSEDTNTTRVVSGKAAWSTDDDSLFPLEGALAYHIVDSLLIQKKQLLIEDITEHWLLQAMNYALGKRGKKTLLTDIMITPVGGSAHLLPLASLMKGHDSGVAALISGTVPLTVKNQTYDGGTEEVAFSSSRVLDTILWYGTYANKPHATIEDLFSSEQYLEAVKEAYPHVSIRSHVSSDTSAQPFSEQEKVREPLIPMSGSLLEQGKLIVERREGEVFERWKVAEILSNHICENPETLDGVVIQRFERLFSDINTAFS
ncbi:MAG: AAA family ATPase [Euryarchaeota archaeon]|nr:AAA family ATPase [Euryarchaeota archaeon]